MIESGRDLQNSHRRLRRLLIFCALAGGAVLYLLSFEEIRLKGEFYWGTGKPVYLDDGIQVTALGNRVLFYDANQRLSQKGRVLVGKVVFTEFANDEEPEFSAKFLRSLCGAVLSNLSKIKNAPKSRNMVSRLEVSFPVTRAGRETGEFYGGLEELELELSNGGCPSELNVLKLLVRSEAASEKMKNLLSILEDAVEISVLGNQYLFYDVKWRRFEADFALTGKLIVFNELNKNTLKFTEAMHRGICREILSVLDKLPGAPLGVQRGDVFRLAYAFPKLQNNQETGEFQSGHPKHHLSLREGACPSEATLSLMTYNSYPGVLKDWG